MQQTTYKDDFFRCIFAGALRVKVRYLIVSIPDLCTLTYFKGIKVPCIEVSSAEMGRLSRVLGVWRRARTVSNVRRQGIVVCNECYRHFTTTRYVCKRSLLNVKFQFLRSLCWLLVLLCTQFTLCPF